MPPSISAVSVLMKTAMSVLSGFKDANVQSLSEYTKQSTISARAYIDGNLQGEPIVVDILRACQTTYISQVINALQLNTLVTAGKTVRELLNVVATESELVDDIYVERNDLLVALEAADFGTGKIPKDTGSVKDVTIPAENLPAGRVIEITLTDPNNKDSSIKVNVTVILRPFIIPVSSIMEFTKFNYTADIRQRFIQWRVGEISFWKDFIFNVDLIQKRKTALLGDKDGIVSQYFQEQLKKTKVLASNYYSKVTEEDPTLNRNIANTIIILDINTVKKLKAETGVDLFNKSHMERYFNDTFAMCIVIVDTMYTQIYMAFAGYPEMTNFDYNYFKPKSRQNDIADLVSVISSMQRGNVRF